jgi:hypothetical protein
MQYWQRYGQFFKSRFFRQKSILNTFKKRKFPRFLSQKQKKFGLVQFNQGESTGRKVSPEDAIAKMKLAKKPIVRARRNIGTTAIRISIFKIVISVKKVSYINAYMKISSENKGKRVKKLKIEIFYNLVFKSHRF